jgi:hypothetical protein
MVNVRPYAPVPIFVLIATRRGWSPPLTGCDIRLAELDKPCCLYLRCGFGTDISLFIRGHVARSSPYVRNEIQWAPWRSHLCWSTAPSSGTRACISTRAWTEAAVTERRPSDGPVALVHRSSSTERNAGRSSVEVREYSGERGSRASSRPVRLRPSCGPSPGA